VVEHQKIIVQKKKGENKERRLGGLQFKMSLGKKLVEIPISSSKMGVVVRIYNLSYTEAINKMTIVQASLWENVRLYLKHN
jgi:hypothetical protein